jgi:predicted DNA-binding transcriptional regulator YafY
MPKTIARGDRNTSWLVVQRGLVIIRRLMRGPATKAELLVAVSAALGPSAYSESAPAAERALKNDRALLKEKLGVEIIYDRRDSVYRLESLGDTAWLDLTNDDLAAIALIYNTFGGANPEAERVRALLDRIAGLLPVGRLYEIQRQRPALTIELHELDEGPIPHRVMRVVQQAITEHRRLAFNYRAAAQSDRQPRYHEVEPYGIVLRDGHYYLESFDLFSRGEQHGQVTQGKHRPFRLQAILDDDRLAVLPEHLPPGRRPQKRYPLRYRLTPAAVGHGVSRRFADMQITPLPDGSAEIAATTTDPWDAVRTLLAYGDSCVVLGGDEVLGLMRKRVAAMAKGYGLLAFDMP